MIGTSKGIPSTNDCLLTRVEVAQALNIPIVAINRFIRSGILEPARIVNEQKFFHVADVQKLIDMKLTSRSHVSSVFSTVLRNTAATARVERKLNDLLELMGVTETPLVLDERHIMRIYKGANSMLKRDLRVVSATELMEWGKTLIRIDQNFLVVAAHILKNREPWQPLMWFANTVMEHKKWQDTIELKTAFTYFDYAARHFRQVAYFFCRFQNGRKEADRRIPDANTGDVSRQISMLMTMAGTSLQTRRTALSATGVTTSK